MPVSNLSPWQQFISRRFGNRQPPWNEVLQAANEFFGPIPIPPGSQVIYQDGGQARYIDAEGYEHNISRDLNGNNPAAGQVREQTNRPAVIPRQGQQELLTSLIDRANTGGLTQLNDEDLANLAAMTNAIQQQVNQQFQSQQGDLIAQLYGRGVNQSTLANDAAGRLLQQQGLVQAQVGSDAANRQLELQQGLTQLDRQSLAQLLGIDLQGQIASGEQALQRRGQDMNMEQFLSQLELNRDQLAEATRRRSPLGSILSGIASVGLGLGTGGASNIGSSIFGAITGRNRANTNIVDTPIPGINNNGGNVYA